MASAPGGAGGATQATALNQPGQEFPSNGATDGAGGVDALTLAPTRGLASCIPADLSVQILNEQVSLPLGGQGSYTILVTNQGPYDAYDVRVRSSASRPLGGDSSWTCAVSASLVPTEAAGCTPIMGNGDVDAVLRLPAGAVATFVLSANLPNDPGPLSVTATAAAPADLFDPDPNDNSATREMQLRPTADLSLTLSLQPPTPAAGQDLRVQANIQNQGPNDASNVRAELRLPAESIVDGPPVGEGWSCAALPDQVFRCERPALAPGVASVISIPFHAASDIYRLSLTGTIDSDAFDPVPNRVATLPVVLSTRRLVTPGGGFACGIASRAPEGPTPAALLLLLLLAARRRRGA